MYNVKANGKFGVDVSYSISEYIKGMGMEEVDEVEVEGDQPFR
eukprot:SAG22_NODE_179_length_16124_cov_7.355445_8_plen_43_part_00